jgi:RNA recognition motif-containing protein
MLGKNGTVVLFIKGLPESATQADIESLFERLGSPRWRVRLTGQGGVCSCDIVRIVNRESELIEYHAMVEIQPAKLALRAIRELNGALVHGQRIELHRYHHRSPIRDRRRQSFEEEVTKNFLQPGDNRRSLERRRRNLRIDLVHTADKARLSGLSRMFLPNRIAKSYG